MLFEDDDDDEPLVIDLDANGRIIDWPEPAQILRTNSAVCNEALPFLHSNFRIDTFDMKSLNIGLSTLGPSFESRITTIDIYFDEFIDNLNDAICCYDIGDHFPRLPALKEVTLHGEMEWTEEEGYDDRGWMLFYCQGSPDVLKRQFKQVLSMKDSALAEFMQTLGKGLDVKFTLEIELLEYAVHPDWGPDFAYCVNEQSLKLTMEAENVWDRGVLRPKLWFSEVVE